MLVVLVIAFVLYVGDMYNDKKRNEILSNMDTRLQSYDNAKVVAREVNNLISIRNDTDYQEGKRKYKKIMTSDLYKEYFITEKYQGGKKYFKIREESITGEIQDNNKIIFKIELTLIEDESETPVTLLVYINNNIIYRIQSLG